MNPAVRLLGASTLPRFHASTLLRFAILLPALAAMPRAGAGLPSVPAARQPATNTYHGVAVTDHYQWLEDAAAPQSGSWTRQQNERTRDYFADCLSGGASPRNSRQLRSEESARYGGFGGKGGGFSACVSSRRRSNPPSSGSPRLTAGLMADRLRSQRLQHQRHHGHRLVCALPGWPRWWRFPSRRAAAKRALSTSSRRTRGKLSDEIPRVQCPPAAAARPGTADSSGVFYTRYPHPGERPEADLAFFQQVWFHRLGAPVTEDKSEIGSRLSPHRRNRTRGQPRMAGG